ncbi:MAG: sel1 repeat family protein [Pedobacter sp.]|nr:MAG: sel1 repeat family protein [Pedobacter sp.]
MKFPLRTLSTYLLVIASALHLHAQDLTGTWVGTQTVKNKKYILTSYLTKTSSGGYSGISTIKEATSLKIPKVIINTKDPFRSKIDVKSNVFESKDQVMGQDYGSFKDGVYHYAILGIIGANTLNAKIDANSYRYVKVKNQEKLIHSDNSIGIEFEKKNSEFPSQFEQYKKDLVEIESISFQNSEKTSKVNFNDRGVLSFSLRNTSSFDLQRISISVKVKEKNAEIFGLEGNNGIFSLPKESTLSPEIDVLSGFDLPSDSVHFIVTGTFNNVTLFSKTIALATNPFFLKEKTNVSASSESNLATIGSFYGLNKVNYAPINIKLNQAVQTGNKTLLMWKAAFSSSGKGGYGKDDDGATSIAKSAYKDVLLAARNGDAEAQYLMYYAIALGVSGDGNREIAGRFLKKSADAGFSPAIYDYGLYLMKGEDYDESFSYLMNAYAKGVQKASLTIGNFYELGQGVEKDFSKAIEWYQKGDAFNDPEAIIQLAKIYAVSDGNHQADPKKVVFYATKAASLKSAVAMNYLAGIYLNGKSGVAKNIPKSVALFKEAANLGDNVAMSSLAYLYLKGTSGLPKDEKTGLMWAKKSAQNGGGDCMALLADLYYNGTLVPKDIIISRFWDNQARLKGFGDSDRTAQKAHTEDFMNVIGNLDFRDNYSLYETYNGRVFAVNEGPDLFGSLFTGVLGAMKNRKENQQPVINGLKHIYTTGGKRVYGGTVTSKITSDIIATEGDRVKVMGYGGVSLGVMAGSANPDGISGFQSYCIDASLPHGSLMMKVNGKWVLAGTNRTIRVPSTGILQFAINDTDFTNNKGYFDFVVTIE